MSNSTSAGHPLSVQFRLGLSQVSAVGRWNDPIHRNVLRLTITRGFFSRAVSWILRHLPSPIQSIFRSKWPGLLLPPTIVIKKLKPDWDDEFNNEIRVYQRLKALQGTCIPHFYGEVSCEGSRALVLSDVNGAEPFNQKSQPIDVSDFARRLKTVLGELGKFGLVHGDLKLENFLIRGDRLVALDLESVEQVKPDKVEYINRVQVSELAGIYEGFLRSRGFIQ